jgi:hypothetical protein
LAASLPTLLLLLLPAAPLLLALLLLAVPVLLLLAVRLNPGRFLCSEISTE